MKEQIHSPFSTVHRSSPADDQVRELVTGAGTRPAIPEKDLAAIRGSARESWLEMTKRERERRRFRRAGTALALAASLVMAIAIGWWLRPGVPPAGPVVASVELVRGAALFDGNEAMAGTEIHEGAVIETAGDPKLPSRVAIRLARGHSVRVDSGSRLRLTSVSTMTLERGAVYVDTAGAVDSEGVEVATAFGRIRDIGTQFEVRVGTAGTEELTVRVREGEISLDRDGGRLSAGAGEQLRLEGDSLERERIAPSDDVWTWIAEATPAMEVDGATLATFLEWVSRETGRELSYGDDSVATSAEDIRVHGSIEGMTPEESLAVILPGSGFDYRIENGSLEIQRPYQQP